MEHPILLSALLVYIKCSFSYSLSINSTDICCPTGETCLKKCNSVFFWNECENAKFYPDFACCAVCGMEKHEFHDGRCLLSTSNYLPDDSNVSVIETPKSSTLFAMDNLDNCCKFCGLKAGDYGPREDKDIYCKPKTTAKTTNKSHSVILKNAVELGFEPMCIACQSFAALIQTIRHESIVAIESQAQIYCEFTTFGSHSPAVSSININQ